MKRKVKLSHSSELIDATFLKNKKRVLARKLARKLNENELREVSGGECKRTSDSGDIVCDIR